MVSISTYGSWAGVLMVAGGYWYLIGRGNNRNRRGRQTSVGAAKRTNTAGEKGAKSYNNDAGLSSGDQGNLSQDAASKKQKNKKQKEKKPTRTEQIEANTVAVFTSPVVEERDDELDNREFARQLQNAKSGTTLPSRSAAGPKQKSVKQSRAGEDAPPPNKKTNDAKPIVNESTTSSTAGIDGDDDLSAANSPDLAAVKSKPLNSADISDMLESSTGPSVLRITAPSSIVANKKEKKVAPMQQVETKKQRQNRKKVEEAKAAREDEEKERRRLMEKQRRTAREAEGRAAMDGSSFMASKAPDTSVWAGPSSSAVGQNGSPASKVELLDTYEPASSPALAAKKNGISSNSGTAKSTWQAGLPSEEEQLRLINEESEWATVGKKKQRKNTATAAKTSSESGGELEKHAGSKRLIDSKKLNENTPPVISKSSVDRSQFDPSINVNDPTIAWTDEEWEARKDKNYRNTPGVHELELEYQKGTTVVRERRYVKDNEWNVAPTAEEWEVS